MGLSPEEIDKRARDFVAKESGRRIRRIRQELDLTAEQFGKKIGVSVSRINVYEIGRSMLPPHVAIRIKDLTGIPTDWVYEGDSEDLPTEWYRKLVDREEQETKERFKHPFARFNMHEASPEDIAEAQENICNIIQGDLERAITKVARLKDELSIYLRYSVKDEIKQELEALEGWKPPDKS